ncbi:BTAD domain-containing putative transcriptional regulator [Streptomyces sp. DSM 42041]|uniref:BTAD domain-containing putative transcriptional regulator n=1 Tax=Streptomyces hazeniae TaxID=3075538 RepID=A0ABU2NMK3_9ACTN|nr:BTAD domain-containing putative transcriptional regulator [Streptomyces sp. DSM 42041]MDT0378219.1 BTAD domain-containing putative transcriptional regulator [Streptomyces sp. DSM 42041]
MRFGILGPVEIRRDGARQRLRSGRERSLLGLLLLHPGRVFTPARLVDLLWTDPPDSARAQVYNLVSRLRQHLSDPRGAMLRTADGGYLLDPGTRPVDLLEFRAASTAGRKAAAVGEAADAAEQFAAALDCWRGTALGGCTEPFAEAARRDLDEERHRALEGLADAQLDLGRYAQVLATVGPLLSDHPHREDLYRRQMLALAAMGRTADALATYRRAYRRLEEDLGVEPGVRLRELHQEVLRGAAVVPGAGAGPEQGVRTRSSPAPQPPARRADGPEPATRRAEALTGPPPRQLPPMTGVLSGREELLAYARQALREDGTVPVVVLSGQGGAGKTALALRTGHALHEEFPDGQLYADLRGAQPEPADPHEVAAAFLRGLGVDGQDVPAGTGERTAALRTRLAGRRLLLVLDDARDEAQVRPLLPGTPGCAVLVTSRRRLTALADAVALDVGTLDPADSRALLARLVGPERVAAEPDAAGDVAELCGHLPLALRIAGARLAARRDWTLRLFRDRLAGHRQRLDQLSTGDLDVRAGIALSYRALPPVLRAALRRLGLLAAQSVPGWVVGALAGPDFADDDLLPDQLVDRHLLRTAGTDAAGQPRFRLHDLVHDFAYERAVAEDPPAEREAAVGRVLRHWLLLASRAAGRLGHGGVLDAVATGGETLPAEASEAVREHPADWFAAERANLADAVRLACRLRLPALATDLALQLDGYLIIRFHEAEREAALRAAIDAWGGEPAGDRRLSRLHFALCWAMFQQDRYAELGEAARRCWEVATDLGDPEVVADAAWQVGRATALQGRLADAAAYYESSARDAERLGLSDRAQVYARTGLANALADLGDAGAATGHYRRALHRHEAADRTRVVVLLRFAEALADRGETAGALESLTEAARIVSGIGDEVGAAHVERVRGQVDLAARDWARARERLEAALATLRRNRERSGTALVLRSLADAAIGTGEASAARDRLREASAVFGRMAAPVEVARTEARLAVTLRLAGDVAAAEDHAGAYRRVLHGLGLPPACLRLPAHVRRLPPLTEEAV